MATSIENLLTKGYFMDSSSGGEDCCIGQGAARFKLLLINRHERIQRAAYFRAERRGFAPGFEIDDWLEAEREVDDAARLAG